MSRCVVGVDVGLAATSVCALWPEGSAEFFTYGGNLPKDATDTARRQRVRDIIENAVRVIRQKKPEAIAMEGPAFSTFPNDRLAELRGALQWELERGREWPIYVVAPSSARKATFDRVPAKLRGAELKEAILQAIRAAGLLPDTHDEADAAVLANSMARILYGKSYLKNVGALVVPGGNLKGRSDG